MSEIVLLLEFRNYQNSTSSVETFNTGETDEDKALKKAIETFENENVKIVSSKVVVA
jgi:hypothetical protein